MVERVIEGSEFEQRLAALRQERDRALSHLGAVEGAILESLFWQEKAKGVQVLTTSEEAEDGKD